MRLQLEGNNLHDGNFDLGENEEEEDTDEQGVKDQARFSLHLPIKNDEDGDSSEEEAFMASQRKS